MKKTLLAAVLLLSACGPAGNLLKTGTKAAVDVLSPICANLVEDQDIIPQQAKDLKIDEKAVCDCGLKKAETKLTAQPDLVLKIINEEEDRNQFMLEVATECSGELLKTALDEAGKQLIGNLTGNNSNKDDE